MTTTAVERTARITGALWLAINATNFIVWASICLIGLRLEAPWWLIPLAASTAAVFGVRWYVANQGGER